MKYVLSLSDGEYDDCFSLKEIGEPTYDGENDYITTLIFDNPEVCKFFMKYLEETNKCGE